MISFGVSILYSSWMNTEKKKKERMPMSMSELAKMITKTDIPPKQKYLVLEVRHAQPPALPSPLPPALPRRLRAAVPRRRLQSAWDSDALQEHSHPHHSLAPSPPPPPAAPPQPEHLV